MNVPPDTKKPIPIIFFLKEVEGNTHLIKLNHFIAPVNAYPWQVFWNSELIKRKRAMEQLDELIFDAIESLRNNKKQPNEDTDMPQLINI